MAQLGDLIVSGKARFLNKISGNIDSADKVNNKLNLTVSGHGTVTYEYDGSSPVSVDIGGITPAQHTHGNIQNFGTLQTNDITIASGDKLVVTDSSDSSKIARTSLSFDGSTATQCLTKKGTWATFGTSNLTIGTTSTTAMAGNTAVNKVIQSPDDSTNSSFELLFSGTADNTEHTEGVKKSSNLLYNPSQRTLAIGTLEVPIFSRMSNTVVSVMHMTNTSSVGFGIDPSTGVASAGVSNSGKSLAASESDITLGGTSNTWDGTNTSLKTAVTAAKGTVRQEILSNFPSGAEYPIALAYSSSTSAEDNKIYKISNLKYDPSWGNLTLSSSSGVNSKVQLGNSGRVDDSNNTWTTGEVIITDTDSKTLTVESRDIYNSSKWDGTNTSLKTALSNKLSLDGSNQMTGNLTIAGSLTAHFIHSLNVGDGSDTDNSSINAKNTNVALSYSNRTNGVTSNRYSLFNALDSNNTRYGYVQFGAYTNGNVSASLRAVNAPYGATKMAQNSLDLTIDKDGNCTYAISDKAAFKTALGLTDIGKIYTNSVSKSITSTDINSPIEGATVTLPKGSYIIFGQWVFNSLDPVNQQRITRCCIKNKTAGTILTEQRICQATGNYCVVQCTHIVAFSASTNVCVAGGANRTSGNGSTYIAAIKISD